MRIVPNRMYVASDESAIHPLESLSAEVACSVRTAGSYELRDDWRLPERVVPNYTLFVITRGAVTFRLTGRDYPVRAGGAILAPPRLPLRAEASPSQDGRLSLHVLHFWARLHGLLEAPPLLGLPITFAPVRMRQHRIGQACRRLVTEVAAGLPGSSLAANGECAIILAMLWREAVQRGATTIPYGEVTLDTLVRFKPVFDLIQERYQEELRVADLAELVHLHPVYFATLFRQGTGLSPAKYLAHYRLGKARELLASTDTSLAEIARRTGHGTASYLSRVFRRTEGTTPSEFRRVTARGGDRAAPTP